MQTPSKSYQPVHNNNEGKFNTMYGGVVDLKKPTPEMININDISTALSHICRFGGHTSHFYSVAQHSVLVAHLAPPELKREALMHDAAEAYLGDVIKPLKMILADAYDGLEAEFNLNICLKYNLRPDALLLHIKQYDRLALELEHEALQRNNYTELIKTMREYGMLADGRIAWSPRMANEQFMRLFNNLFPNHK